MANLFIICGHGDGDPGACGNGYQEAERVRALAGMIKYFGGNSVTIGDTSRNWYADKLINNINIPKGSHVLELHMDSGASTARGAHVIIKGGHSADKYDIALSEFLANILPGRANKLVGRSDLANPNRAASAGINYRLAECGFISNAGDVKIFNAKMDELAKGILKAFDIVPKGEDTRLNALINDNDGSACTRMVFEAQGDYFKIKDKEHGYFLTATSNSKDAKVEFTKADKGDMQLWKIIKKVWKNADYTMFECKGTPGLYLSVEKNGVGSSRLKLWSDLQNLKQKFYIREESDGTTLIIHTFTGKVVSCK